LKISKVALLIFQKFQTLPRGISIQKEQLSLLANLQIPSGYQVKNSGTKINFESSLNFKGVQTFLEKSDKFLKILSSHDILEYNFTLTQLYSNIGSFFTSGKNYLV
jgi:hypothetical protein